MVEMRVSAKVLQPFRETMKQPYAPAVTGLFHGVKPIVWMKCIKPKYNHWQRRVKRPAVSVADHYSEMLGTHLRFASTPQARERMAELGGIDNYFMVECPKLINNARAFSYKHLIASVQRYERERALRARDARVREIVQQSLLADAAAGGGGGDSARAPDHDDTPAPAPEPPSTDRTAP